MEAVEAKKMITRLENSAVFLEMCSSLKPGDMGWDLAVIERKYTAIDVLRQAAEFIKKGKLSPGS